MVRRQCAARHRWTGRHLRFAHRVHAGEQGLRAQRSFLNGTTTAALDAILTWLSLVLFYGSSVAFRGPPRSGSIVVGWTNRILITTFVLWLLVPQLGILLLATSVIYLTNSGPSYQVALCLLVAPPKRLGPPFSLRQGQPLRANGKTFQDKHADPQQIFLHNLDGMALPD